MAGILRGYDDDAVLTPSEIAAMFGVNRKTVTRWADERKLPSFRTMGGHRRFRAGDVRGLLVAVENAD
jgi:excisionase family DNA binding protein